MVKHKKTKCNKIRIIPYSDGGISEWKCPKCKRIFQCGDRFTKKMYCKGE